MTVSYLALIRTFKQPPDTVQMYGYFYQRGTNVQMDEGGLSLYHMHKCVL